MVSPAGLSGLNAARAAAVVQSQEKGPALILLLPGMDRAAWVMLKRWKSATRTNALIVSNHALLFKNI